MDKITQIVKGVNLPSLYYVTLGALVGSGFNLETTFYCAIGAALGFALISAVEVLKG